MTKDYVYFGFPTDNKPQKISFADEQNQSAAGDSAFDGVSFESHRCIIPVTPLTVGRVMSKDDAHYAPHRDNPFPSRFRNGGAKVGVEGVVVEAVDLLSPPPGVETVTPPPTPTCWLETVDVVRRQSTPRVRLRSRSLPGSAMTSRNGSDFFGCPPDTSSDTGSSVDSALGVDVSDSSSWGAGTVGWRKKNAEQTALMVQYLEDLEALFGSSVESSTTGIFNDCSSCASLEEAILSPSNSASSRDGDTFQRLSEHRVTVGSPERFRALVQHWETRQSDVTSGYGLPVRLRYVDPCVVQKFNELRRLWEEQQLATVGSVASRHFNTISSRRTPIQSVDFSKTSRPVLAFSAGKHVG